MLDPAWDVVPPAAPTRLDVVERVGADLAPVDPTTTEGERRLTAYVWPDQLVRLARLRGAVRLARDEPVRLVRSEAADLLDTLELAGGALTVVWHSVMWQYLDAAEQARMSARLAGLGTASDNAAVPRHGHHVARW